MILIITSLVRYNKHTSRCDCVYVNAFASTYDVEAPGKAFDQGKWQMDVEYQEHDHDKLNLHDDQCIHKVASSCKSVGKSLIKPMTTAARSDRERWKM